MPSNSGHSRTATFDVAEDDVANREEEEDFATGVRQNAIEFRVADTDNDNKLDFDEFCAFVRDREAGTPSEIELLEAAIGKTNTCTCTCTCTKA